jgi:hypothetical protein
MFDSEDEYSTPVIPVSRDTTAVAELNKQVAKPRRIAQDRPSCFRELGKKVKRLDNCLGGCARGTRIFPSTKERSRFTSARALEE